MEQFAIVTSAIFFASMFVFAMMSVCAVIGYLYYKKSESESQRDALGWTSIGLVGLVIFLNKEFENQLKKAHGLGDQPKP